MSMYSQAVSYAPQDYDAAAAAAATQLPAAFPYGAPQYAAAAPPAQHYGYGHPQGYVAGYGQQYSQADELRTLFVTGFPTDMHERELNNLLRFLPGYEASQLHQPGMKSPQAQGFALFDSGASAQNALRHVANLIFEEGSTLRCELARKNMYIKDDTMTKRSRYDSGGYGGYGGNRSGGGYGAAPGQPHAVRSSSANTRDNAPCSTLFVGNLGDGTKEEELQTLFSSARGFRQVKMNHGARGITCFVEYEDVVTAMDVHKNLQGATLDSSDRGPVRIQYSRNPFFGKKRERDSSQMMDSSPAASNPLKVAGAVGGSGGDAPAPSAVATTEAGSEATVIATDSQQNSVEAQQQQQQQQVLSVPQEQPAQTVDEGQPSMYAEATNQGANASQY